jgi:hypothetical protein
MGMRTSRVILALAIAAALPATVSARAAEPRPSTALKPAQAVPAPIPANAAANSEAAPRPERVVPGASKHISAPEAWTAEEISGAKSRCAEILKRIQAVTIAQPPIREGACGAPAPIQLVSIGKNPEVAISPPATVTCELAEGLYTWLKSDLQPLAKQHLGADIIKIETMSDYSCRAAYGRSGHKLSEHGHANALDIRGFVAASAKTAYVLEGWGKPEREVREDIAAAKAAEERTAAAKLVAAKAAETARLAATRGPIKVAPPSHPAPVAASAAATAVGSTTVTKSTIVEGTPKLSITLPGSKPGHDGAEALTLAPDKLGGPKVQAAAAAPAKAKLSEAERMALFLRGAHASACRIFGTTLGPEANDAHRNHFHVDMAERKTSKFCE